MTQEKLLENNKLIAEFMGIIPNKEGYLPIYKCIEQVFTKDTGSYYYEGLTMHYHESWDWLMPVVEKINTFNLIVTISSTYCKIEAWEDSIPTNNLKFIDKFTNTFTDYIFITTHYRNELQNEADTLQKAVYKAVIEFIKWYNKNK